MIPSDWSAGMLASPPLLLYKQTALQALARVRFEAMIKFMWARLVIVTDFIAAHRFWPA